ncbi:hypothetical protein ABB37_05898 [Leptomonas pyrrhocoris]|uniref:Uncharacterized protein n=1 Tax=Leptomonas pyrrhocoris TaxID=157538 RepID=A0A0M9FYZ6_LEPPY|nr:hypothetical protein ABB37_05898 [Leptomonas pyrrhocoris]KPA78799.1 hypothetical protein ABB37_05898 [Leptomonas pyrrhocoris]|eukprot:XP_015657238.1 hypothetical protein ABB37_05898 [Leptomonas pyrrhocoris]
MEYSLFALLAILLVIPVVLLVIYLRGRAERRSRRDNRRRLNDLVEFYRARRAQQWAALSADGVPGIVLRNAVDASVDPLRRAPPSTFAEAAPGNWSGVSGGSYEGDATNMNNIGQDSRGEALEAGTPPPLQQQQRRASPSPSMQQSVEVHVPYGGGDARGRRAGDRSNNDRPTEEEDENHVSGVMGKLLAMESDAADAMPTIVEYGEAAYLPRSLSNKSSRQLSVSSVFVESECAVESACDSHRPLTPSEDHVGLCKS